MDHYNIFEAPDILVNGVQTQNYSWLLLQRVYCNLIP